MTLFFRKSRHARVVDSVIGFGRIVSAGVDGARKAIVASLRGAEDEEEEDSEASTEAVYGTIGVVARPRSAVRASDATGPNPDGYAEIVGVRFGDRFTPIAGRDLRLNSRLNPAEGDIALVGYGGGFVSIRDAADLRGSQVVVYAPKLDSSGEVEKASAISLDPDTGAVSIVQQDGCAFILTETGAITRSPGGDAFTELTDDQFKVSAGRAFTYTSSWQVYVPNADQTQAHTILVDNDTGAISIVHRTGSYIIFNAAGDIIFRHASGRMMTFGAQGLFVDGNVRVKGCGYFGDPSGWALPASSVLTGLNYQISVASNALFASVTPPLI